MWIFLCAVYLWAWSILPNNARLVFRWLRLHSSCQCARTHIPILTSLQCYASIFAGLMDVKWQLLVGLICISYYNEFWAFFMCFFCIWNCIDFLVCETQVHVSFLCFSIWFPVLLIYRNSLYILDSNPLF